MKDDPHNDEPGHVAGTLTVEITLSEAQHSAQFAVYMTDTVVVRLTEDPGGGHRWRLSSVDPLTLEMIEHHYEPPRAGIGSGGASVWSFKPRKAGRTRLSLLKQRAGNADGPPAEHFAVILDIR